MLGRLLIGIVKGLVVGSLLGIGLIKLGVTVPLGALVAYLAAAVTGIVIGLVAGKPIWAKDAKIEAGSKAVVGALLGLGLMAAARHWLLMPLTIPMGSLVQGTPPIGEFPITALAGIAALLGGFYEADNDSSGEEEEGAPAGAKKMEAKKGPQRIAAAESQGDEEDELESESDKKRSKK